MAAAGLVSFALIAAACGGDDDDSADTDAPADTETPSDDVDWPAAFPDLPPPDGEEIVVGLVNTEGVPGLDFPDPALHRWTLDTATGTFTDEQVDDLPAEFPRVPDSLVGLQHRYGYMMKNAGTAMIDDPMSANGEILKYDRETGQRTSVDLGRGRLPGESSFVPSADPTSEDDGYLMTFVYDAARDASEFAIFDAQTMSDEPVATVQLPRIPFGFHGNWVDASVVD